MPTTYSPLIKRYWKLIVLVIVTVLLAIRVPKIWIDGGRFWSEEGTIFFQHALTAPWWKALFFSYGGYLNLPVNAATLIARDCIPLVYAPYCTMLIGLSFQLIPYALILNAKDSWLATPKEKILALALILLVPESVEISIQSLHIQFSLALACALILCLDLPGGKTQVFERFILFLAPLSGPASILLSPLFILRAVVSRSKERFIQTILISFSSILQMVAFYHSVSDRNMGIHIMSAIEGFVYRIFIYPLSPFTIPILFSPNEYNQSLKHYNQSLYLYHLAKKPGVSKITVAVLACLILLLVSVFLVRWIQKKPLSKDTKVTAYFLLGGSLFTYILTAMGGLQCGHIMMLDGFGARYVFIPQTLSALAIALIYNQRTTHLKLLVAWLMLIGITHFIAPTDQWRQHGPAWSPQVSKNLNPFNNKIYVWGDLGTEYISTTTPFKYPGRTF